jgi:hypothetical protein
MEHTNLQNGPHFSWADRPVLQEDITNPVVQHDITDQAVSEISVDGVVSSVKTLIETFMNNQTESTLTPTTVAPTLDENVNRTIATINPMVGIEQTSMINDMFESNSTFLTPNTMFNEMAESNLTVVTTMQPDEATNVITEVIGTTVETVVTTTENVINTLSDVTTNTFGTTTNEEDTLSPGYHGDYIEDNTLYIVLGVILTSLILILIILLIVYKRYKSKSGSHSNVYCVTDLNEVSVSSSHKDAAFDQRIAHFN